MSDGHFDIEHFPTSPSAVRMLSRISPIYDKSYVGKWIFEVMGLEFDDVRLRFDELKAQAFPETATWGLVYWEQRYGIVADKNALLEERRRAVLARRSARAPMNPAKMEQIITTMTGRPARVTEDVAPYTFSVEIETGAEYGTFDFDAVMSKLKRIKPSHQRMLMYMVCDVSIKIAAVPRAYLFPYRLAGTYPQTNTPGRIERVTIENQTAGAAVQFPYPLTGEHRAGTLPQDNITAHIERITVENQTDGAAAAFSYPFTGEHYAGTLPQDNVAGGVERAEIEAITDGAGTLFPYKLAGTIPQEIVASDIGRVTVEDRTTAEAAKFPYKMAGTIPGINTAGGLGGEGVAATVETETAPFEYPVCGDSDD